MKVALSLLLIGAFVAVAVATVPRTLDDEQRMFNDFAQTYGRAYEEAEKSKRFECFRTNLKLIDQRNEAGKGQVQHGVNQFTDLCPEEFKARYLTHRVNNGTRKAVSNIPTNEVHVKNAQACSQIDWRSRNAVTPVINEGQCGSCWAWSTLDNIQGILAAAGHPLVQLSAQELIDCSSSVGNMGCNGGELAPTYEWILQNGGIDSAADYPYRQQSMACNEKKRKHIVAKIGGYVNITSSESVMANYVCTNGPINVAVEADTWQTYTGGVLTGCPVNDLDFSVAIVGLDMNYSPPYWLIKNIWGTSWGENGYIRIEYGSNQCGINTEPLSALPPQ